MNTEDSLIHDAIERQLGRERFTKPGVGRTDFALEVIERSKENTKIASINRSRNNLKSGVLKVAVFLAAAAALAVPVASRDFARPLARCITASWTPELAESLETLFLGEK